VTRIDLTTSELHGLIAPVMPHTATTNDPDLSCINIEVRDNVLHAVASDRFTLAATRHPLDDPADDLNLLIDRADAAAMLKLFTFTKDEDPPLTLIIDKFPVPVGGGATLDSLGLRVDAEDGTRLVLHDRTAIGKQWPMAAWRTHIGKAIHRPHAPANPALLLTPAFMPRWAKAAGKGERIMAFVGPEPTSAILVVVEDHFIGLWLPCSHLDSDKGAGLLHGNPWLDELPVPVEPSQDAATA
jgi:hypothetical protein